MAASVIYSRRLVDRKPQLKLLAERYASALEGSGSIVIVSGEAGSGKSRLVAEFVATLALTKARHAAGRCFEYAQSPYAPFLAALGSLVGDESAALPERLRAALAPLMPELGERQTQPDVERDKLRQLNALAEAFQYLGTSRPAVIVLEDVHWADSASLELLLHLVAYVGHSGLLLIVTCRSDEPSKSGQLQSVLSKLERDRHVFRMELLPLSDTEMRELIDHALAGAELPSGAAAAVCARAEGNPLFIEELLKTVTQARSPSTREVLPATLRETISGRLATLDKPDRDILVQASAIGRRFAVEFLARIAEQPAVSVLSTLKRAIDAQFIAEQSNDMPVLYAFRHELVREVLYSELLTDEARALHRKIALSLESLDGSGAHVSELAYHFWRAREKEKLIAYCERAGDNAAAVFAYQDAAEAYEHALSGEPDAAHRAELNKKIAFALHQCGDGERAARALEAAQQYYEAAGDAEKAARTCLNVAVEYTTLGDTQRALLLNRRALELVKNDPSSTAYFLAHAQLLDHYTQFRWDPEKAQEHVRLAERSTAQPSWGDRVDFLESRSILLIGQGDARTALRLTRDAADLAIAGGAFQRAVRCWGTFAANTALAGEVALANQGFDHALEIMADKNIAGLTGNWTRIYLAYASLYCGDLHKAHDIVVELLASGIEMKSFFVHLAGVGIPVGLALEDEALVLRCAREQLIEGALQSGSVTVIDAISAFAELFEARGESKEARSLLHRAVQALEPIRDVVAWDAHRLFLHVARAGEVEDLAAARSIFARAARASQVLSNAPHVALFDAYVALRDGDKNNATELAAAAASAFHDIGWPLHEAHALEVAHREKDALALYQRTGALRYAKRIQARLMPVNRQGRRSDEPTAREREILELLVAGKSNKNIAEALVISERTVEDHISSILAKLGVSRRSELIARYKGSGKARGDR